MRLYRFLNLFYTEMSTLGCISVGYRNHVVTGCPAAQCYTHCGDYIRIYRLLTHHVVGGIVHRNGGIAYRIIEVNRQFSVTNGARSRRLSCKHLWLYRWCWLSPIGWQ